MNLLKTMFYPVFPATKTIYIDPHKRSRDVPHGKWQPPDVLMQRIRGDEIMSDPVFSSFKPIPTVTRESVLAEWKEEATRSKYLWESAAKLIAATIEEKSPENALADMKKYRRAYRAMAVSASYERAINDLKTVISQQAQAS